MWVAGKRWPLSATRSSSTYHPNSTLSFPGPPNALMGLIMVLKTVTNGALLNLQPKLLQTVMALMAENKPSTKA